VPGRGMASDAAGGAPGDLLVVVHSAPDERFARHGMDLVRLEHLGVAEAALGVKRMVTTLDGDVEVTAPPGTQPGSMLRLAGKGVPALGGGARGDLYLRVLVHVPERLSKRQRELFEKLLALGA